MSAPLNRRAALGAMASASALAVLPAVAMASSGGDAELLALQSEIDAADAGLEAAFCAASKAEKALRAACAPRPVKPEPVMDPEQAERGRALREYVAEWCGTNPNLAADAAHNEALALWRAERERLAKELGARDAEEAQKEASDAVGALGEAIINIPATTLAGLVFKARYAAAHYRDEYDLEVMTSIVDDLLNWRA